jgi:hypothetical protein
MEFMWQNALRTAVLVSAIAANTRARADEPAAPSARGQDAADRVARDECAAISQELHRVATIKGSRAAIAAIEKVLPGVHHEALRWRLELARQAHLENDHQHGAALDNARRLLTEPRITSEQSEILFDRVAFNLFNLDRVEEGILSYDRQILNAVDHPVERLGLLEAKAQMLLSHVEPARGIPAWREYRMATEPRSEKWQTATAMLALELARNAQHAEAIALREELIKQRPESETAMTSSLLFEIAKSQQALGLLDQARQSLEAAEKAIPLKARTSQDEQEIERLQEQIAVLGQSVRKAKSP